MTRSTVQLRRISAPATLLVLFALIPAALSAQSQYELPRGDGEPYRAHPEAVEAVNKLKSPYCPTMLEVCPSPAGAALRDSIADLAEQGRDADWIVFLDRQLHRHEKDQLAALREDPTMEQVLSTERLWAFRRRPPAEAEE